MKRYWGERIGKMRVIWVQDGGAGDRREIKYYGRHWPASAARPVSWGRGGDPGMIKNAAYAILMDFDERLAEPLHEAYAREVLARVPERGFEIGELGIRAWLRGKRINHEGTRMDTNRYEYAGRGAADLGPSWANSV